MKMPTINTSDYNYLLSDDKIALFPCDPRDSSKLLIYKDHKIHTDTFKHLADYIPENTLLVMNNSKVIEARLFFKNNTGATIEIFCLSPDVSYASFMEAIIQKQYVKWNCLVGGAKKWKEKSVFLDFLFDGTEVRLEAKKLEKTKDGYIIEFSWNHPQLTFSDVLSNAGNIPLPPYIKRKLESSDTNSYQTIYAVSDGSVAAPTAGLHFTENVFRKLEAKKITTAFLTLHVGAGTFLPIKTEQTLEHEMHTECIEFDQDLIKTILHKENTSIISVGTTTVRTLESIYWMGVKVTVNPNMDTDNLCIHQWEAYHLPQGFQKEMALNNLLEYMQKNELEKIFTTTQIMIIPTYKIRMVDAILTNFHQPQSTLLLLISAFVGDDWKKIYAFALENDYRFLSYGDSSLLWLHPSK